MKLLLIALALLAFAFADAKAAPIVGPDQDAAPAQQPIAAPTDGLSTGALLGLSQAYGAAKPEGEDFDQTANGPRRAPAASSGSGHSLRDVARSILTVDPLGQVEARPRAPDAAPRNPLDDGLDARLGVVETLLDNETLGKALESVVRIIDVNGNARVFSIFGLGEFQVKVSHDDADAGASRTNEFGGTAYGRDQDGARASAATPTVRSPVNLILLPFEFFLEFLGTPFGIVLATLLAIYMIFSLTIKFGSVMRQRRTVAHRKSRRRRPQPPILEARPSQPSATPHRHRRRTHRYSAR